MRPTRLEGFRDDGPLRRNLRRAGGGGAGGAPPSARASRANPRPVSPGIRKAQVLPLPTFVVHPAEGPASVGSKRHPSSCRLMVTPTTGCCTKEQRRFEIGACCCINKARLASPDSDCCGATSILDRASSASRLFQLHRVLILRIARPRWSWLLLLAPAALDAEGSNGRARVLFVERRAQAAEIVLAVGALDEALLANPALAVSTGGQRRSLLGWSLSRS
jgi:hypothetical protein